ncbi:GerAB/ArcD/ProY family transporter [Paenibacillus sp. MBLB4367]|uniref:GerAB/ArcD/ProY family transporter n=1 Tax=Paenibacillus sp. MBLB4367 TaxID=3384767 RepID=UPI0039083F39
MDQGNIKSLNKYHVVFLIQNVMTGIGLLSMPHGLAAMGYDSWWMPLLMAAVVQATIVPMIWLCRTYPEDSLYDINRKLLGKWLGSVVNIGIILYALTIVCPIIETYSRIVQAISFPNRSILIPVILFLAVALYIAGGGIKLVARFCIVSFVLTFWIVYYLQWAVSKGTYTHLLPIFQTNISEMSQAFFHTFSSLYGYELLLLYFPFIQNQKKAWKHLTIGLWLGSFFYALVCFVSVIYFSVWQLENIRYPVLFLFKSVELTFIERIENVGLSLWLFLILSTAACYLWAACKGIDGLLGSHRRIHLLGCGLFCFLIMFATSGLDTLQKWLYTSMPFIVGWCIILLPLPLMAIHGLRRRFGKTGGAV